MEQTIARAAPVLKPRIDGSASGLRDMPCITVPATPSPAPTRRPRTVRGILRRMAETAMSSEEADRAWRMSEGLTEREPKTRDRAQTMTRQTARISPDKTMGPFPS